MEIYISMTEPNGKMLKEDVERYVIGKLKEIYWGFRREISPRTTFKELDRYIDSYLIDPGLLIYIEEDLGVYLPDEEAMELAKRKNVDVAALVDAILRHANLAAEKA